MTNNGYDLDKDSENMQVKCPETCEIKINAVMCLLSVSQATWWNGRKKRMKTVLMIRWNWLECKHYIVNENSQAIHWISLIQRYAEIGTKIKHLFSAFKSHLNLRSKFDQKYCFELAFRLIFMEFCQLLNLLPTFWEF